MQLRLVPLAAAKNLFAFLPGQAGFGARSLSVTISDDYGSIVITTVNIVSYGVSDQLDMPIIAAGVIHCLHFVPNHALSTAHHLAVAPEVEDADCDAARAVEPQRQLAHVAPRVVPEGRRRDAAARQQGTRDPQLQRRHRALRVFRKWVQASMLCAATKILTVSARGPQFSACLRKIMMGLCESRQRTPCGGT